VILRMIQFGSWAIVGMVASYCALYAFTPYGLAILGLCCLVGKGIHWASRGSDRELLGLGAGPALFCLLVASSAQEAAAAGTVAGASIVAAAAVTYFAIGRANRARGA
jgi:hypothetical protein